MSGAYYNENDPFAAEVLRQLIAAGHIAPGDVDERSSEDVTPDDLKGYPQCHFFAGVGAWSLALRRAGWPDDRRVWTGSCPCQPFSASGKRGGFDDERHLWPAWYWLIQQCRPATLLGEQVASKAAELWVDLVQADLEALGYAFGCVAFPSAGVGAPHIRDRAYWVADGSSAGLAERVGNGKVQREAMGSQQGQAAISGGDPGGLANLHGDGCDTRREASETLGQRHPVDANGWLDRRRRPGPTNGFWRDVDWLRCRDERWRPVEPATFPLADGAAARVGRLRCYGNAVNAEAARVWVETVMESVA